MPDDQTPIIEERENGPLVVKGISSIVGSDGVALEAKPVMALCRCGQSKNKPFCDGSHKETGFSSARDDTSHRDRVYSYEGAEITVHYNKLLCSHAGECGKRLLAVFDPKQRPWVQPDNGDAAMIREVVAACPSGALRASEPGGAAEHAFPEAPQITVEPNGPYRISDVPILNPKQAEGSTEKKYVLCRCGLSGNKPYCDGTHHDEGWKDR